MAMCPSRPIIILLALTASSSCSFSSSTVDLTIARNATDLDLRPLFSELDGILGSHVGVIPTRLRRGANAARTMPSIHMRTRTRGEAAGRPCVNMKGILGMFTRTD